MNDLQKQTGCYFETPGSVPERQATNFVGQGADPYLFERTKAVMRLQYVAPLTSTSVVTSSPVSTKKMLEIICSPYNLDNCLYLCPQACSNFLMEVFYPKCLIALLHILILHILKLHKHYTTQTSHMASDNIKAWYRRAWALWHISLFSYFSYSTDGIT